MTGQEETAKSSDTECGEQSNHHAKLQQSRPSWMSAYELLSAFFAGGTLVAVIIAAVIYNGQLKEMQKATKATQDAAKAAGMAATVAQGQLEQMKSGSEQTDKIIAEAHRISDAMDETLRQSKAAMDASILNAEKSLTLSSDTAKRQLRAYLGVDKVELLNPGDQPPNGGISVSVKNYGQTPATDVDFFVSWVRIAIPPGNPFPFVEIPNGFTYPRVNGPGGGPPVQHIFPHFYLQPGVARGVGSTFDSKESFKIFDPTFNRSVTVYFYGNIDFTDVFGIRRRREYCFIYVPILDGLSKFQITHDHNAEFEIPAEK
jgi:hypothetical protein